VVLTRKDDPDSEDTLSPAVVTRASPLATLSEVDPGQVQSGDNTEDDSDTGIVYASANETSEAIRLKRTASQPTSYRGSDSPLQDALREAIADTCKSKKLARPVGFVPRRQLRRIMTEEAVAEELETIENSFGKQTKRILQCRKPSIGPEKLKRKARRILGGGTQPKEPGGPKTNSGRGREYSGEMCFRKIFAILILIERAAVIGNFVKDGMCDDYLPVRFTGTWPYRVYCSGDTERRPKCFWGWRRSTLQRFEREQWKVLAPVFTTSAKLDDPPYFGEGTILPFTEKEIKNTGTYGKVYRVKIHPEHFNFKGDVRFPLPRQTDDEFHQGADS